MTPKAAGHAALPPMASRFVEVAGLPWEPTRFAGVDTKILLMERESGVMTVLMRMAPGAKLPDHEHALIEQTYV
ncbi:MAG: cupin domain-containing protein, partial [Proteobacteria bacterium]|nr:cupin domain-containing protein [Pseudomonadota bacterium]